MIDYNSIIHKLLHGTKLTEEEKYLIFTAFCNPKSTDFDIKKIDYSFTDKGEPKEKVVFAVQNKHFDISYVLSDGDAVEITDPVPHIGRW